MTTLTNRHHVLLSSSGLHTLCTVYLEVCRLVYSTIALELLYAQLQVLLL